MSIACPSFPLLSSAVISNWKDKLFTSTFPHHGFWLMLFAHSNAAGLGTGQLNGDGTFGSCRSAVDMLGLGFCSMGGANHPAVWSYIQHQTEGELMYTVTFREMERAALSLLTANVDKKCDFTRHFKHLLAQTGVQNYMKNDLFKVTAKLPIDQVQCGHQAGWCNFSLSKFGLQPNICSTHLTGKLYFIGIQI